MSLTDIIAAKWITLSKVKVGMDLQQDLHRDHMMVHKLNLEITQK